MTATVIVHSDLATLAAAAAARLVTRIVDAQAATGQASIVLSGGGVGIATLRALAAMPARDAIDWPRLDMWWGDERYLPAGHAERNETQAREALLDHVDVDPKRMHPMPAAVAGVEPEVAAETYAAALRAASRPEDHAPVPTFDVLLLGIGPDGHIASLFPEKPALHEPGWSEGGRSVLAVRGAPKAPPTRITLTLPAINAAREVWLIVAGAEKSGAARLALSGAGSVQVPAAGAAGRARTLWLLDRAAAAALPPSLARAASP
ncbi:MAG: 6-phosphogluconolactonase [Sporichthyaceae bacterium]